MEYPPKSDVKIIKANPVRKVIRPNVANKIPDDILNNQALQKQIELLPANYDFEIPKTIWRIQQLKAKRVALQMPEGLLMYSITISDIIEDFTGAETVIMGDVTYGACCVDDLTAEALQVDLLVHYGHSCLLPIDSKASMKFLYIFVNIKIDVSHFYETIVFNFPKETRIAMVSVIQFLPALHETCNRLKENGYTSTTPRSKPLSPGEILGCTAPRISDADVLIFLGDGRFHLEAAMIANPNLKSYKYDPYTKILTEEFYDHTKMRKFREDAISYCKQAKTFGILFGTLGRQGNPKVLEYLSDQMAEAKKDHVIILISEIMPHKLKLFGDCIDAWIQIACPRLSIDWGTNYEKPLLSPYEAHVFLSQGEILVGEDKCAHYPMDFYSDSSLGKWTPNHKQKEGCCGQGCNKAGNSL